jgi:hypothetical protein
MPPSRRTEVLIYALPIATAINFFSESFIDVEYTSQARKLQIRLLQSAASAAAVIAIYEYLEWLEWKKKNLSLKKCGLSCSSQELLFQDLRSLIST